MLDSGYNLEWNKYQCPLCKWLLKDAVQISCGHWLCLECAQEVFNQRTPHCPKDDCAEVLAGSPPFFPDRFVRREIARFSVHCVNHEKGCTWTGLAGELQLHFRSCQHSQIQCQYCNDWIVPAEQNVHLKSCPQVQEACPFADIGCKETENMTRPCLSEHLTGDVGLLKHLQVVAHCLKALFTLADEATSREHVRDELETFAANQNPWLAEMRTLKEDIKSTMTKNDDIIARLRQLEQAQQSRLSENEDRDFRLSNIENSNFDGTAIWKIPSFLQRMEDARTGKYTSIYSLPFYTGRYGYKMCLRLYILGDGVGRSTHMSLFLVLMKGDFDNLLQWPFTLKVTFKLLNQSGGRDITDSFQPDPLSNSFQKPTRDMNVAAGCPRFVSLRELMSGGFVVDDTVFIKAKVDITKMRHP